MMELKVNGNLIEVKTEYAFNFIECDSEKQAELFFREYGYYFTNPKFKKTCYYIKMRENGQTVNKLIDGYKVDGLSIAVKKLDNGYWYADHFDSGLSLGLCGCKTRVQCVQNAIYAFFRILKNQPSFERIN